MSPTSLLLLALALSPEAGPDAEPAALVERLGSARYADRERAARDLEARGRAALPALRAARGARDPEVRARAAALVERIESGLLTRPTLVRLDYRDRPLADVARDLSEQTGMTVAYATDLNPDSARRVTLREPDPLPVC